MSLTNKSILLILIAFMCVSCTLTNTDRSFLTDQPCAAPCWYGIVPGESSKAEVVETLNSLPFVDERSIKEYLPFLDGDGHEQVDMIFNCVSPLNRYCGGALFVDDQLIEINLHVGYALNIETVVTKLGPPTMFYYREYHPEVGGCTAILAWPELGIIASHTNKQKSTLCDKIQRGEKISKDIRIHMLIYTIQENFNDNDIWFEWPGLEE